ncbi:Chitosanase-domain-containing protein [Microthyrium microscopicum]|uniref:Endo-chitosanase n=1 Tax=Microthyrium microscopicum TaxID=703497 RepID=A0A6A6UCM8_9PEZI|nr:Chitosanase-domain-containing protein [Microthyrium microscopicum]
MRIRCMTYSDVGAVADIGKEVFANDKLFNWLYPYKNQFPNDSHRWQMLRLRRRLLERGSHGFVCETETGDNDWDETEGPVIVGYIFFIVKGNGEETQKWQIDSFMNKMERYLLEWEAYYEQRFLQRAMDRRAHEMYANTKQVRVYQALNEYWYIGVLGVNPRYQRRGIGAKLVNQGLQMAEDGELPVVLDATAAGKGLYTKLGFKTVQLVMDLFGLMRDIDHVFEFQNSKMSGKCAGGKVLKDGFHSIEGDMKDFAYCQDQKSGVIYVHGNGTNFANMDVDCDGQQSPRPDDRCGASKDTQSETSFRTLARKYSKTAGNNITDLNANYIPFVVFGNTGSRSGYTTFDPKKHGIQPLSVMAVVCGDKLIYGVWGDSNGDDGPPLVGEASIALATACYGSSNINGNQGHDVNDVLYIAFPGSVANTVNVRADWAAKSYDDFERSIESLGNELIQRLS